VKPSPHLDPLAVRSPALHWRFHMPLWPNPAERGAFLGSATIDESAVIANEYLPWRIFASSQVRGASRSSIALRDPGELTNFGWGKGIKMCHSKGL
jgi:hypothetical protein